jgi:Family of unknown function (DUF6000)
VLRRRAERAADIAALWGNEDDPSGMRTWRAVVRWVTPGDRYLHLHGRAFVMARPRQWWFQWRLRRAGRRASATDLALLLDHGGWRGRLAASWLIAAGRRTDLRPVLERRLLSDDRHEERADYCAALACLGTQDDARILAAYLDGHPVADAESGHCPDLALAALRYLDAGRGGVRAYRGAGDGGEPLREVREYVAFGAGRDPGRRRRLAAERPPGPAS